jgi:hypothetical protein
LEIISVALKAPKDTPYPIEASSETWRPTRPDLAVSLEAFQYHFPLGFVLPEVMEDLFLIRIVLADPLQTSLHKALDVLLVKSQT